MGLEQLKRVILEYQAFIHTLTLTKRPITWEPKGNYVIVGPRRAGKTYLLYQKAQDFCEKEGNLEKVIFINFEDERFLEFSHKDFETILQAYYELFDHKPFLFFDEIHVIEGWEKICSSSGRYWISDFSDWKQCPDAK